MSEPHSLPARLAQPLKRRRLLVGGAIAGFSTALGGAAWPMDPSQAATQSEDAALLNHALFYEHQAIWAYSFAASQISETEVGRAVKALALRNQSDHMAHRAVLTQAVESLGATPVAAAQSYDVSAYLQRGEGNVDSDINLAKLALALEVDAAIAYTTEVASLKTPALITAGASIGCNESSHAAAIRAAFVSLGVDIPVVPASFVNAETRQAWILKV